MSASPRSPHAGTKAATQAATKTEVSSARRRVHDACLRMVSDGLVVASSGNISVRTSLTSFVVTAGGVPYNLLQPGNHPEVSTVDGSFTGTHRPTSELELHLALYRSLPEVGAIVHTHSRYAAAFSVAGVDLPFICNENIAMHAEKVLVTDYSAPGTRDLGEEALRTFARQPGSRAVLLANHGVVAIAEDLETAYNVAAQVEWVAHVLHLAANIPVDLGPVVVLSSDVQDLIGRNYDVTIARESSPANSGTSRRPTSPQLNSKSGSNATAKTASKGTSEATSKTASKTASK